MSRYSVLLVLGLFTQVSHAQFLRTYALTGTESESPASNSINELLVAGDTVWVGTSRGPSIRTSSAGMWFNLASIPPLKTGGISGIAVHGDISWVSYATSTKQDNESLPTGDDLYVSTDRGATWQLIPQPVDEGTVDTLTYGINRIAALTITTKVNNITYDIAASANSVWIANFAGMLRRSDDNGLSWQRVILPPDSRDSIKPTDSLDFDLAPTGGRLGLRGNLNHRVFSVTIAADGSVWAGTAGGVNRSTDNGVSWRKFSRQNQTLPISGNFVVAVREQTWGSRSRIWAATVNAEGQDEFRGVSYTDDGGETWQTALGGSFAHNFAFRDSVVYVATDKGLFRSTDLGLSWVLSGTIADPVSHQRLTSNDVIAVAALGDTVWIGGRDGTAWTVDTPASPFGSAWNIQRTAAPILPALDTYSYPLPFAPDEEVVRIRYSTPAQSPTEITIRVFDFGMLPVRTIVSQASRAGGREYDEIWDGRTDAGDRAANGVYFYRVEYAGHEPVWGKIMVVQ